MADTYYLTSCDLSQGVVTICSAVVWSCCVQVKLKNLHAIRRLKGRLTALKAMAQGVSVIGWARGSQGKNSAGLREEGGRGGSGRMGERLWLALRRGRVKVFQMVGRMRTQGQRSFSLS